MRFENIFINIYSVYIKPTYENCITFFEAHPKYWHKPQYTLYLDEYIHFELQHTCQLATPVYN